MPVEEWLYKPGLPGTAPTFRAEAFAAVEKQAKAWAAGTVAAKDLPTADWSTQEWLHFLDELPADADGRADEGARRRLGPDASGRTRR